MATIGPATGTAEGVRALVEAGMDAARLNLSHGSREEHAERARLVRGVQETIGRPLALIGHPVITTASDTGDATIEAHVKLSGRERWLKGQGNGPIAAFVDALRGAGVAVEITDYSEHALSEGADARAAAYVEARIGGRTRWGVGLDANIMTASLRAVVSAVNRV